MTGLATVVANIRSDINRGSAFDSRIKEAIENAIRFYKARRYRFNTKRKTNFSISTEFTSLTANFIEVDYLKIVIASSSFIKTLTEEDYVLLSEQARDLSLSDEPQFYAIQNGQLRVYPAPDQSYSCEMQYLINLPEVSASASDSASNAWLSEGYELIKTHATIEVLEAYVDGDEGVQKAQRLRAREAEVERELKRYANRQQSSGSVRGVI